ncbi:hypothetical protein NDU88_001444 [Pleurodeles waltl]|uniref:Uncharacterized protein n=1 Tax=Pleurodeles waltl TaxID=8319 RepID=A0AAV7UU76_PLEWA|nr:hypothetical protein NDU88_001444 [Pleurodeles waltl]
MIRQQYTNNAAVLSGQGKREAPGRNPSTHRAPAKSVQSQLGAPCNGIHTRPSWRQSPGTRPAGTPGAHHVTTSPRRVPPVHPRLLAAAVYQPPADLGDTSRAKSTRRHNPKRGAASALSPASSGSLDCLLRSAHACPNSVQAAALPQAAAQVSRQSAHSRGGKDTPAEMLSVSGLRHAPRPARLTPEPGERAPTGPAGCTVPHHITRPRSDEPGRTLRAAHLRPSRQSQGKHQGPK